MKDEIVSAAEFLAKLLKIGCADVTRKQTDLFRCKMEKSLQEHFRGHWFPQKPYKGSGYRCLRINHKMDPIIAKATEACGLRFSDLQSYFPNELTVWIDPREVSYRIGENGSICVLFDGADELTESSSCSSDSDLESTTPPSKKIPVPGTTTMQQQQHNRYNYSHPFPTPPSSPPTVQGSSPPPPLHQYVHHTNHNQHQVSRPVCFPSSNGSCRRDLNSFWNPSSGHVSDPRSAAIFNMEQLAPYVTS